MADLPNPANNGTLPTDQPSSGRTIRGHLVDVPTTWTTILEAQDFSIPSIDSSQEAREVIPGEIFIGTPLAVTNKFSTTRTFSVRIDGEATTAGAGPKYNFIVDMDIPGKETVFIPVQGHSLLKTTAAMAHGDRLQVKAGFASTFDVTVTATETAAGFHLDVEEE